MTDQNLIYVLLAPNLMAREGGYQFDVDFNVPGIDFNVWGLQFSILIHQNGIGTFDVSFGTFIGDALSHECVTTKTCL